VIGSNTTEAHPVAALRMKEAVRKGATLVVADPRAIWLTKIAKRHLQLRPGTDVWLLNAMLHVILAEGLEDATYVAEHTEGIDEARAAVAAYTPEEAERVTGVPAEAIRATAREYALEPNAAIFYTLGITEHVSGVDNVWALANLVLATGHLGRRATGLYAMRGQNNVQGGVDAGANPHFLPGYHPVESAEHRARFAAAWNSELPETPGYRLDEMLGGAVRALYLVGEDPAQTDPNAHHVEAGLAALDFLVMQDIFLNDTARAHADVVFPAACYAEKDGTFTNTERRVSRVRKAVEPPGEARADWEITDAFARALGADWPAYPTAEAVWDEFADLAPMWNGIRYDRLEENGIQWPCPDRSHPGTVFLHEGGPERGRGHFQPVAYQPPDELPDEEYPLTLSTGRTLYHYNAASMTRREAGIRDKLDAPFVEINRADAGGIAESGDVRITTRRGTLVAAARIGERVPPGTIWMALHFVEAKANWLTNDAVDPRTGTGEYKVCAARIEPIPESVTVAPVTGG